MTIWKFHLAIDEEQIIEMPIINKPLTLQLQNYAPCLWMLVDPDSPRIKVRIRTVGTGHSFVLSDMEYVGTYQAGSFIWHVFIAGWLNG